MQSIFKSSVFLISTLMCSAISAGQLTIQNTFTSGTPAVAADVNSNFAGVKIAVDDNDARITSSSASITTNTNNISSHTTLISNNVTNINAIRQGLSVYDNGIRIGAAIAVSINDADITILSDTGYIEIYSVSNVAPVYFTSTDCTGQAYLFASIPFNNGYVQNTSNTSSFIKVYSLPGASASINTQSQLSGDSCSAAASTINARMASTNDQVVTGLPDNYTSLTIQ